MTATVPSATLFGVRGRAVSVEVHVSNGLPGFTIVGLPDASCREARDRVRAALLSSGLPWPLKRVTVNLAPSGLRKGGSQLDLAIAVGLLVAEKVLEPGQVAELGFVGELGLDGTVRDVTGTVPLVAALACSTAVVAQRSVSEAELVGRHRVRAATTLTALVAALRGEVPWPEPAEAFNAPAPSDPEPDLADVRGQALARLALELSAAGGHHLLMVGTPGAGKTMLARRLPGLLPDLTPDQALDATMIHSAAGVPLVGGMVRRPPFRAPHHGASTVSLTGGGSAAMRPGEMSLAHHGVLFMDELGEFQAGVIDALRQPLEEGVIRVSRAAGTVTFPARMLLVAAMNPCPCGLGGLPGRCSCSETSRLRYHRRVSGPILDRFDLRLEVTAPDVDHLLAGPAGESTEVVRQRVLAARERASARGVNCNSRLRAEALDAVAPLTSDASAMLERCLRAGQLTGRGLHRVRRIALTIADCCGRDVPLDVDSVALALQLRERPAAFHPGAVA